MPNKISMNDCTCSTLTYQPVAGWPIESWRASCWEESRLWTWKGSGQEPHTALSSIRALDDYQRAPELDW